VIKYRIYIDEVGNSDLDSSTDPNHRYLSLTGVIFELEYVKNTQTNELEQLKEKYFGSHPDEPIILHRKELVNKKYPFNRLKNKEIELNFNADFLSYLENWDYTIITVLIDKYEHKQQYNVWRYDPYHYCLAIILERYYKFLVDRNAVGDVMIESRGGKEDIRLKNSFKRIFIDGTNFIRGDGFQKVITSKELKVKSKSSNIAGLQIADVVAYPSRQFVFEEFGIEKKLKVTFNDEIISRIKSKYLNKKGRIKGYGIKLLP
jgi:hypothetical protein